MRKLIAGMKTSVDGKIEGPDGFADWVDTWTDDYGLTPRIDACLLGGHMYPGYERYWTAMQTEPDKPLPMTGRLPTPAELEWARFAAKTPHYVLSNTLSSAISAKLTTRFVPGAKLCANLRAMMSPDWRGRSIRRSCNRYARSWVMRNCCWSLRMVSSI